MRTSTLKVVLFAAVSSFILWACNREEKSVSSNKARLQVALTDDPGDYDAVYIDVRDVQINVTSDSLSGWQSLANVASGRYDLLKLVNDDDTILADAEIPVGRVQQLRLILGPDNYVVVDGDSIKLQTPSAQQSGLKLNIHQDVSAGIMYKLLLDFDVAKSIHKTGNGKYMLKPVIRTTLGAVGGSLKGWVRPDSVTTAVLLILGPDTVASTYTDATGGYAVRGLNPGSYNLLFLPGDTVLRDTTRMGISVTTGNVTVVDTMFLH
ncbi:MAG TPA: DUF4382 domain-containing protein [Chitinophagaceae bacterium]